MQVSGAGAGAGLAGSQSECSNWTRSARRLTSSLTTHPPTPSPLPLGDVQTGVRLLSVCACVCVVARASAHAPVPFRRPMGSQPGLSGCFVGGLAAASPGSALFVGRASCAFAALLRCCDAASALDWTFLLWRSFAFALRCFAFAASPRCACHAECLPAWPACLLSSPTIHCNVGQSAGSARLDSAQETSKMCLLNRTIRTGR